MMPRAMLLPAPCTPSFFQQLAVKPAARRVYVAYVTPAYSCGVMPYGGRFVVARRHSDVAAFMSHTFRAAKRRLLAVHNSIAESLLRRRLLPRLLGMLYAPCRHDAGAPATTG